MGMIRSAIEAMKALESLDKSKVREMRYCAILSLVATAMLYTIPYICGYILDWMVESIDSKGSIDLDFLFDICTVILLMVVMWYVATNESKRRMTLIALAMTRRMREELNSKMMRVSITFTDEISSGDVATRFTSFIPSVSKLIASDYTGFIIHVTMIFSILVMMLITSPLLGLLYIALIPGMLYVAREITRRSEADFKKQNQNVMALNSQMSNMLSNHRTIKAEVLEEKALDLFMIKNRAYTAAYEGVHIRSGMISTIAGVVINIGYLLTVLVGSYALYAFDLDVGMFLTFMIYVRVLTNPLMRTVTVYNSVSEEMVSLEKVLSILSAPEDDSNVPDDGFHITEGVVRIEDLTFAYDNGHEVFRNASVEFRPGEFTVVTGPTGCGKTTLANILMGFYRPTSGRITIDGRELSEIPRAELGINLTAVLQNPWMFTGTIRENIVYNRTWITDEEVKEVAELTGLDNYVRLLPQGYDTPVSEEVDSMPLAQRRMLALSRAIIGNPKVLILDEAVAGLDPMKGQSVIDRLMSLKEGHTIIIITHNKALIEQADTVVTIENGAIKRS
ncbi:MAG: ABC transporter ATP-binding protein [Candidatus Methanomethylophilaceae archaeon]|nr:ABC transporter ATP-binding protein [Candidatus Methanomethylophilaceae archaeon]MBQ7978895.1 ABC transporter ATP-binding protein [Candidatus Methanomethylophilaceae archaeon]